jgi:hypothetical protein
MVTGHLAGTLQLPYGAQNVGPSGQLLGPRNWYLPRWLGWLPQSSRPAPPPTAPPSAAPPLTRVGA